LVSKVFYLNSDKYPAIVNDYQQVKERVEIATALGMASLALINLPENK